MDAAAFTFFITMEERLQKQLDFILKIDEEKNIMRQTHLSHHGRNENDAEHAWHMAIMAFLLEEYANEPVDICKVMKLCLIHDLVEIEAGDTYAYDEEGLQTQKEREEMAAEHLFSLLPDDQKQMMLSLFHEFDYGDSIEARFARTMDNFQPLLLNHSNQGGDWQEHQVTRQQVEKRQSRSRFGSEKLYEVTEKILDENEEKGLLKSE